MNAAVSTIPCREGSKARTGAPPSGVRVNYQVELVRESPVNLCDLVQAFGKMFACCGLRQVGCQGTWKYLLSVEFV